MSTESQMNAQHDKSYNLQLALAFQASFPLGGTIEPKVLGKWLIDYGAIEKPKSKVKSSASWGHYIKMRNEQRYQINRIASNPKFAKEGGVCFEIQYLPKDKLYQVFSLFDDTRLLTQKFEEGLGSYISNKHRQVRKALNGALTADKDSLNKAEIDFLKNIDKNLDLFDEASRSTVKILKSMFQTCENQLSMAKEQGLITNGETK